MYELVFRSVEGGRKFWGIPEYSVVARVKKRRSVHELMFLLGCWSCIEAGCMCPHIFAEDFHIRKTGRKDAFLDKRLLPNIRDVAPQPVIRQASQRYRVFGW